MNKHRKQFIKEKREYEKLLKTKAKEGTLSLAEKEQYQDMMRSKKRNRSLRMENVAGKVISTIVTIVFAVIWYFGPDILQPDNYGAETYMTDETIVNKTPRQTSYNNKTLIAVNEYIDLSSTANDYFNKGIQAYNATGKVEKMQLSNLETLYKEETNEQFKGINNLLADKIAKQIDILSRLDNPNEDKIQLKDECEIIRQIDNAYKKELYVILEGESIQKQVQIEPVYFYVSK